MCIDFAALVAPESGNSPSAQHESHTRKQNGKRPRDLDMEEGPQQKKGNRNDVCDLLLYGSTYLITLSSVCMIWRGPSRRRGIVMMYVTFCSAALPT